MSDGFSRGFIRSGADIDQAVQVARGIAGTDQVTAARADKEVGDALRRADDFLQDTKVRLEV